MSMNNIIKKNVLYIFFFFLIFCFTLNVYAKCSDFSGVTSSQEECESHEENDQKCVWKSKTESYKGGKRTTYICMTHEKASATTTTVLSANDKQKKCREEGKMWRQGACYSVKSLDTTKKIETKTSKSNTDVSCSTLDTGEKCGYYSKCMWNNNACIEQYVASSPCNDERILLVLRFFGYLLLLAKVAIPLIIIAFGTFDLLKSVVDKDEKSLIKQTRILLIRIAIGIFIFFIPAIVNVIFSLSPKTKFKSDYNTCKNCLLTPTKCSVSTLKTTKDDS